MILWLVPTVIFFASLAGILFLIAIKLPALASLPAVAPKPDFETRRKEKLMSMRFQRIWRERMEKAWGPMRFLTIRFRQFLVSIYRRIQDLENRYQKKGAASAQEERERIQKLVWTAGELVNQGQFDQAEKKFIEAITWDHKNVAAYKGLADLYLKKKEYQQAKETLEYTLKITATDPEVYWELATVLWEQGQLDKAAAKFSKALELAPSNPKYLDNSLEINLLLGRKDEAWKLVARLKESNPENQKVKEFEERIRKL